jgi:hypothetical protein
VEKLVDSEILSNFSLFAFAKKFSRAIKINFFIASWKLNSSPSFFQAASKPRKVKQQQKRCSTSLFFPSVLPKQTKVPAQSL